MGGRRRPGAQPPIPQPVAVAREQSGATPFLAARQAMATPCGSGFVACCHVEGAVSRADADNGVPNRPQEIATRHVKQTVGPKSPQLSSRRGMRDTVQRADTRSDGTSSGQVKMETEFAGGSQYRQAAPEAFRPFPESLGRPLMGRSCQMLPSSPNAPTASVLPLADSARAAGAVVGVGVGCLEVVGNGGSIGLRQRPSVRPPPSAAVQGSVSSQFGQVTDPAP